MTNKEKGQRNPRVVVEFVVVLLADGNLLSRNAVGQQLQRRIGELRLAEGRRWRCCQLVAIR